jgi:hypothetical protein
VNPAPAIARRRPPGPPAGAPPPGPPPRARLPRARAAALALAVTGAAAVAAAGCAGAGAPAPGDVFRTRQQVSLQQVNQAIDAVYRGHPGIATFAAEDVQYTPQSRDAVLRTCTSGAGAGGAQTAESGRLIACAPLIFFLYRYGRQASVPAAVTAAGDLYWYAVTHISGPVNAQTSLDALLHGWKLPVPGLTAAQANSALVASVVNAASDSILAQKSVRVTITGQKQGSAAAERIVADIGTATGTESISSGPAVATIRVTKAAAYFTGSPAGLSTFIGLPAAAAAKARSRWVAIAAGTNEYADLAAEDTIADLPASILPGTSDPARLRTATLSGRKVYVLDWSAKASGSATTISERLVLAATTQALPLSETTTANGNTQTVTLDHWGEQFAVPVPASAIPYASVTG